MSTVTSYVPSYNQSNHNLRARHGSHAPFAISRVSLVPTSLHGCSLSENQAPQLPRSSCTVYSKRKTNMTMNATNKLQPGSPEPPKPHSHAQISWILGSILTIILPAVVNKWKQFLIFQNSLEGGVNIVGELASNTEQLIEKEEEKLPNGGRLKKTALALENVAKEIVKYTQIIIKFIHKLKKVENDVVDLIERDDQTEGQDKEG